MRERALYTSCLIGGEGELRKNDGTMVPFLIKDISAVEADIILKGEVELDQIYSLKISFSASLREININIKGRLSKVESQEFSDAYVLTFVDITEIQKIEIDEILKKSCIRKEIVTVNEYFSIP